MEEGISRKQEMPAADFIRAEEWMPLQALAAGSKTSNHSGLSVQSPGPHFYQS